MSAPVDSEGRRSRSSAVPVLQLDSGPESFRVWVGGLWRNRNLLYALAQQDFRSRYKRAAFGVLWSIALPLFQSAVMVFIFSRVGRFGSGLGYSYAAFVLAGMVPWLYLSTSIASSTTSIVDASGLTDKVFFPRAVLPLVAPAANLVMLAISTLILLVALPIVGEPLTARFLLIVPAVVLLCTFTAAVGLALSALYVYFRDVKFMVQAVLLVWLYVTPVVYPPSALKSAGPWLDFNPLTGIVGLFQRAAVDAPVPSTRSLVVSVVATALLAVVAVVAHRRHDRLFVDLL
ncbi:MAG: type transporter [Actinomycetia bacterium]|nr:type transporter [Actinomycetes bacterium]